MGNVFDFLPKPCPERLSTDIIFATVNTDTTETQQAPQAAYNPRARTYATESAYTAGRETDCHYADAGADIEAYNREPYVERREQEQEQEEGEERVADYNQQLDGAYTRPPSRPPVNTIKFKFFTTIPATLQLVIYIKERTSEAWWEVDCRGKSHDSLLRTLNDQKTTYESEEICVSFYGTEHYLTIYGAINIYYTAAAFVDNENPVPNACIVVELDSGEVKQLDFEGTRARTQNKLFSVLQGFWQSVTRARVPQKKQKRGRLRDRVLRMHLLTSTGDKFTCERGRIKARALQA